MKIKPIGKRAAEVAKQDGLFVMRPLLNAEDWVKWATAAGIPGILAPEQMHVTIVSSPTDVKLKLDDDPMSITTDRACVCLLGPKENALAVVIQSWQLWDRFYAYCEAGAFSSWVGYRPHLTLSYDAAGFEISDDALNSMPDMVILGGEVRAALGQPEADATGDEGDDDGPDADNDDDDGFVLIAAVSMSDTREAIEKGLVDGSLDLLDEFSLREVIRRQGVTKSLVEAVKGKMKKPLKPKDPKKPDIMPVGGYATQPAPMEQPAADESNVVSSSKGVEKEVVLTVRQLSADMIKSTAAAGLFKSVDEEHLVYGWASVSTVKGALVEDLQGDTITVKAQREFAHSLMRGQREGKFEHMGKSVNEVVEILVLDADLQKALGIDLGMEGMIAGTYVPDPQDWELVKSGDWMYSIAGTVIVLEDN
jgi:hypothetical protein